MLAVWAPKVIRLRSVLWRSVSGSKTWGNGVAATSGDPDFARPASALAPSRVARSMAMTATDRGRPQDHEVDEETERERRVARDAETVGDGDHRQLERADEPGPGRDDRGERDAARQQRGLGDRQLDVDRLARRQEGERSRRTRRAR